MSKFAVWAPAATKVDLVSDGRRIAMTRAPRGWWEASDPLARTGTRYGFSLDGGQARPDPRSHSQPDGVLGLSEVIDHAAYRWGDTGWRGRALPGSILYELHVGTFSPRGTFDGAMQRVEHLVDLGVDAVELMPVAEFSGDRGWGYDGVDLFAPHHAYGGPDGLKRLVDACHTAGLAVVLDVVYNHLGPAGNFLSEFGPYFTDSHHTSWGAALNFDGHSADEVRRFVVDNALMWIRDYHIDGLRLDAVHAIVDQSAVHVLEQLATEVENLGTQLGRSTFVIAESDLNDPRLVRSGGAGGYGLDAAWADDWHHALHTVLTGERAGWYEDFGSLSQLGKALRQAWVYDGVWSPYRDAVRGRKANDVPPHAFVVAMQNHDQVGNRAAGERLSHLVDAGRLKAATALLLTSSFTPLLFQGEEWAAGSPFQYFTDHPDPALARAVSEGRRLELTAFGLSEDTVPDPQDPGTFERSRLKWDEIAEPFHQEMLDWYRGLIALRRRLPMAVGPVGEDVDVAVDESAGTISFARSGVMVQANIGQADWTFEVEEPARLVLASPASIRPSARTVCVPPSGVAVFETSRV